jgi:hypothetical protein
MTIIERTGREGELRKETHKEVKWITQKTAKGKKDYRKQNRRKCG